MIHHIVVPQAPGGFSKDDPSAIARTNLRRQNHSIGRLPECNSSRETLDASSRKATLTPLVTYQPADFAGDMWYEVTNSHVRAVLASPVA